MIDRSSTESWTGEIDTDEPEMKLAGRSFSC